MGWRLQRPAWRAFAASSFTLMRCQMLTKTSNSGLVVEFAARPPHAVLADFDIDGSALKSDHTDWLDENVIVPADAKRSSSGGWMIDLIGKASQSGSDGHNLWLSDQRARSVQTYLLASLPGVPMHFFVSAVGESAPLDLAQFEHELDRSVEVRARFIGKDPPKPLKPRRLIVKPHIWKRPVNRKTMDFELQVLKAQIFVGTLDVKLGPLSVGQGHAQVKMLIKISEIGSTDEALYEFEGSGPGSILGANFSLKGFKPGLGASKFSATYEKGEVHRFATDIEMDADEFGGHAMFRSDLLGRTLSFGPKKSFFSKQKTIKDLSFGLTRDTNLFKLAEATTPGDMQVVESAPAWAK
jgi:hypothetical protein